MSGTTESGKATWARKLGEIALLACVSSAASVAGLYFWYLQSLDREVFAWGIHVFFPWLQPLKAVAFYPVLMWYLGSRRIARASLLIAVAGSAFGLFEIIMFYWAIPFGPFTPLFFIAQFASQSAIALGVVSLMTSFPDRPPSGGSPV